MKPHKQRCIRPVLLDEESLSSYFMRIAKAYYTDLKEVFAWYINEMYKYSYSIDVHCNISLNTNKICEELDVSGERIRSATFSILMESFRDGEDTAGWSFIGNSIEKKKRNYCPKCLKMQPRYKLLWQVNELQICDEHEVYLECSCPCCSKTLPYLKIELAYCRCPHCLGDLSMKSRPCDDGHFVEEQKKVYEEWRYILNHRPKYPPQMWALTIGQYTAVKMLYIAQNYAQTMNRDSIQLSRDQISRLVAYVNGETDVRKRYVVTLQLIRSQLLKRSISSKQFYELIVPDEYILSVLDEERRSERRCLSPWCISYGNGSGLTKMSIKSNTLRKKYEILRNPYLCKFCSIKYGFNDSGEGEWVESEKIIENAYNLGVPLLNSGCSLYKYATVLQEKDNGSHANCMFLGSMYIAYLLRHDLLSLEVTSKYKTFDEIKDPVPFFRILLEMKGSKIRLARRLFNWGQREYYYHFFHPGVQILFSESYSSTLIDGSMSGENTKKEHSVQVRISREQPYLHHNERERLWGLAKNIIKECEENKDTISDFSFYEKMGKGVKWLKRHMPDLLNWYFEQKDIINNQYVKHIESQRLNKCIEVVVKLFREGTTLSQEHIALESGIERKYLRLHGLYPIINAVIQALLQSKVNPGQIEGFVKVSPTVEQWRKAILE